MINPENYHWRALFVCARLNGISQKEIAKGSGLSKQRIGELSSGDFIPGVKSGSKIIGFLSQVIPPHLIRVCTKADMTEDLALEKVA